MYYSYKQYDPAKAYATKAYEIDGMDVPGLVALARQEDVDGVLVGVADVLVYSYCQVCEALGLPCYASKDIVKMFNYKDVFKSTCERYGIHGVKEYYLDENLNKDDVFEIEFPVMVKPVDSHSGLGMTVVYDRGELDFAVKKAISASKAHRFIVESYMECEDVGIYYTFKEGYCSLSCIYDRFTTNKQKDLSRVNLCSVYPSRHIDQYYDRMHDNAIRMFREIGIRDGVLLISAFYKDGEFYVYDPGFRLQGEAPNLLLKHINGYDQIQMLIEFALTGKEGDVCLDEVDDSRLNGNVAATIWVLLGTGEIENIDGFDCIEDDSRIVETVYRLKKGDIVFDEWIGTEKQVMCRFYAVCRDKEDLKDLIRKCKSVLKVTDEKGQNMIVDWIDEEKI